MVIVEINFLGLMKKPEKAIYPGYEIPGEDEYSLMWMGSHGCWLILT